MIVFDGFKLVVLIGVAAIVVGMVVWYWIAGLLDKRRDRHMRRSFRKPE